MNAREVPVSSVDKLKERLRSKCKDRLRPPEELWELMNPDGPEAADEITRLNAEVERLTNLANPTKLHAAIEHGDEEHRAWLREALVAYFDGRPIPADRGGSRKQALIDEMVEGLERAAGWFEEYANEHYAKARTAPDGREQHGREVKGKVNADRAKELRALILKARGKDSNVG